MEENKCRDIPVSIATSYSLDGRGSIPGRSKVSVFSIASRLALESIHPPIQWLKRPERESDHLPPSSAKVKNCGVLPPLPHMPPWRGA
jgi:hypothetical protein